MSFFFFTKVLLVVYSSFQTCTQSPDIIQRSCMWKQWESVAADVLWSFSFSFSLENVRMSPCKNTAGDKRGGSPASERNKMKSATHGKDTNKDVTWKTWDLRAIDEKGLMPVSHPPIEYPGDFCVVEHVWLRNILLLSLYVRKVHIPLCR